jgi:hypothetical protein
MSHIPEPPYEGIWRDIKRHLRVQSFAQVSWESIYRAKRELGYPLTEWESEGLARVDRLLPPVTAPKNGNGEDWWQK